MIKKFIKIKNEDVHNMLKNHSWGLIWVILTVKLWKLNH
jgi:hypothetical protein